MNRARSQLPKIARLSKALLELSSFLSKEPLGYYEAVSKALLDMGYTPYQIERMTKIPRPKIYGAAKSLGIPVPHGAPGRHDFCSGRSGCGEFMASDWNYCPRCGKARGLRPDRVMRTGRGEII